MSPGNDREVEAKKGNPSHIDNSCMEERIAGFLLLQERQEQGISAARNMGKRNRDEKV